MNIIKVVETHSHIGEIEEEKLLKACKSICTENLPGAIYDCIEAIEKDNMSCCTECLAVLITDHGLELKRK